jgi:hypothetical protein
MTRDTGAGHRGFGFKEGCDREETQTMNDQRQLLQVTKGSDIERAETKSVRGVSDQRQLVQERKGSI